MTTSKTNRVSYAHMSIDDWKKIIANWKESGKSQHKYCKEHNLTIGAFSYWRSKLRRCKQNGNDHFKVNSGFAKVGIIQAAKQPASNTEAIKYQAEFCLSNGNSIRVFNTIDAQLLKTIIKVIGR